MYWDREGDTMSATHGHPLAGRFSPAIDRLRTRAAKAGDALWTEGPVQPDHKPLDLCAEAMLSGSWPPAPNGSSKAAA